MEDYPRTQAEFEARFATEAACRQSLVALRWPDGVHCPSCGEAAAWTVGHLFECRACGHQTSVTAGTIFQDTRTPLATWFRAMWWVTGTKTGTSALGLQRVLGLGSYQTAWAWLHKLRRAMVRPGRERLTGHVEVDETLIGGVGTHGRSTAKKALVVVAAEEVGHGIGRLCMRRIPEGSSDSLLAFVQEAVAPGAEIHTDGWRGYDHLRRHGYGHRITYLRGHHELASELLPRVHRVVSLFKRWRLGTHQGAVTGPHLDYYLDEFTFRFNRRRSRHRGTLFFRLAQQAVAVEPAPYRQLVKNVRRPRRPHRNL